jgi:hypothetical protein
VSSPDLMDELAKAVQVTKRELNSLDDIAEQVNRAAARVIANPGNAQFRRELRTACDQLVGWQIADVRSQGIKLRARALGRYRELAES